MLASLIPKLLKSPLARGSFVLFLGSIVGSFGNYLFNLLMGRMLGPESYGVLAALVSLLYIVSVPSTTLTTTIVKFTSEFKGKEELGKIALLLSKLGKIFLGMGIFIFLNFVAFSSPLCNFLKVEETTSVILLGALFLVIFPQTINNGILQGLQRFTFLSLNGVFAAALKLILGVLLVFLGFSVPGALLAIFLSMLFSYLLTFWPLKFLYFKKIKDSIDWKRLFKYTLPVFGATLGLVLMCTTDIILVKRFFPSYEAGLYSALSLVGRAILFATTSIVSVMFALISERYAKNTHYQHLFLYSLLLVGGFGFLASLFYFFFPNFVMQFFFGSKYLEVARYLGFFAIFISLYSLCNLFVNFYLSIHKTRVTVLPLLASLVQVILLFFFHQNFRQVIAVSTGVSGGLLTSLLLYYYWLNHKSPSMSF